MDNQKNDNRANLLAGISLACLVMPLIVLGLEVTLFGGEFNGYVGGIVNSLLLTMPIVGLVVMILVRCIYPKNVFGKIVMWLYILIAAITILMFIVILVMCHTLITGCVESCEDCLAYGFILPDFL